MSLLLTVVSATFFTAGALQPRYGVIGKANNGRGPAHQSITQRSGSNGEGNMNGTEIKIRHMEPRLMLQSYQVPIPEPAPVILLASG